MIVYKNVELIFLFSGLLGYDVEKLSVLHRILVLHPIHQHKY